MHPTLQLGDILIVKSDLDLKDNKHSNCIINNNDYTVKRYSKKEYIYIDNSEYPNIEIQEEDTVLCLELLNI